jgi:hypothetical protein
MYSVFTQQPDYYGYRDEDDGIIVSLEAAEEAKGKRMCVCLCVCVCMFAC